MKYISVQAVASRLKDHFAVEMDLDQVIMHTGQVLKNIGMVALQREVIRTTVDNFCVQLPSRVANVRAVVRLDGLPPSPSYVDIQPIWFPPQTIWVSDPEEDLTTLTVDNIRNNYIPQVTGPYIEYLWECPYVKFNETDLDIAIISTSMKQDSSGYPMIPEDAFEAAVYYCLYVFYQPLFIIGKIDGQRMQTIEMWKNQKLNFAKTSHMLTELSQNEMDNLLNVMTSFDRKKFGINA